MPSPAKSARKGSKGKRTSLARDVRALLLSHAAPESTPSFVTPIDELLKCRDVLAASDALHRAIHIDAESDARMRLLPSAGALLPP